MATKIPLKKLCITEITDGTHKTPTYSEKGYIFLSSKNVTSEKIDWDNVMYIPENLHLELHQRLAPQKDDILLAKNGTTGVAAIVDRDVVFDIYVSLALIRPNQEMVIPKYLLYAINSDSAKRYFNRHLKGVGVPNLHLTHIRETPISVPTIETQREIVNKLDKVSDLIAKRRQQLDKLDEMVQSRFVEMFGDPEINPMEWPTIAIGETVVKIESGWSGNGTQRERKPNEIAVLKVSSVTKGYFIPEECKVLDDQKNIKKYISPQRGDLLFSRANTKEMVGATAIIRKDYPNLILPDKLWKIRFFDTANVVYMKYILSSKTIRNKFSSASTGTSGSMYNVSMEKFKSIKIPLPGVREQNYFAIFVEETEKIRISISRSLDKLETLKKALMQDYFG